MTSATKEEVRSDADASSKHEVVEDSQEILIVRPMPDVALHLIEAKAEPP